MKRNRLLDYQRHGDTISMIRDGKTNTVDESPLLDISFPDFCRSLKIKTDSGIERFELLQWQADFAELLLANPQTPFTLLSSRQTGKTMLMLALLVWLCLTREQFTGLVVHRKGEDARLLARRAKKLIPDGTRLESDSLSLLIFKESQSQIHFRSSNHKVSDGHEQVARGIESVDCAFLDESGHTKNLRQTLGVLSPCLTWSDMANIVLVGTAGAKQSYYYDSLVDAYGNAQALEDTLENIRQNKIEPYQVQRGDRRIAIITNWRAIPKFAEQENYLEYIARTQDLTEGQIASEHELHFDSDTSQAVFDFKQVLAAQQGSFEDAVEDGVYFAAVDGSGAPKPGRRGGDYTCCIIIKKDDEGRLYVVKLYRKRNISFERRYAEISELLNQYQPIYTLVEANDGLGQTYHEQISSACPSLEIQRFINTDIRKANIISKVQLALERQDLTIPKSPIIDELLSFQVLDNGRMEGVGRDAHDDCIVSLSMSLEAARYGVRGIYD